MALYLTDAIGITGANIAKLVALAAFLGGIRDPWIILADWNVVPADLEASGWPAALGGTIMTPAGIDFSCTAGQGRLLDYAVVSKDARPMITALDAVHGLPWKTHLGLRVSLNQGFLVADERILASPGP